MKNKRLGLYLACCIAILLVACGGGAEPTATVEATFPSLTVEVVPSVTPIPERDATATPVEMVNEATVGDFTVTVMDPSDATGETFVLPEDRDNVPAPWAVRAFQTGFLILELDRGGSLTTIHIVCQEEWRCSIMSAGQKAQIASWSMEVKAQGGPPLFVNFDGENVAITVLPLE